MKFKRMEEKVEKERKKVENAQNRLDVNDLFSFDIVDSTQCLKC